MRPPPGAKSCRKEKPDPCWWLGRAMQGGTKESREGLVAPWGRTQVLGHSRSKNLEAGEMAQQVRSLVALAENWV